MFSIVKGADYKTFYANPGLSLCVFRNRAALVLLVWFDEPKRISRADAAAIIRGCRNALAKKLADRQRAQPWPYGEATEVTFTYPAADAV